MSRAPTESHSRVVIVGAGFGGLTAAKRLANTPLDVTVVDQHNCHLFQPLLYQVATASLSPADIASPLRGILRDVDNVKVILAKVSGIDVARQEVVANGRCMWMAARIRRGTRQCDKLKDAHAQIRHRITGDRKGQSNGRGVGWEYVHVCIDDHSRVAFAKVMPDEKKRSAIAFLKAALVHVRPYHRGSETGFSSFHILPSLNRRLASEAAARKSAQLRSEDWGGRSLSQV